MAWFQWEHKEGLNFWISFLKIVVPFVLFLKGLSEIGRWGKVILLKWFRMRKIVWRVLTRDWSLWSWICARDVRFWIIMKPFKSHTSRQFHQLESSDSPRRDQFISSSLTLTLNLNCFPPFLQDYMFDWILQHLDVNMCYLEVLSSYFMVIFTFA